MRTKFGQNFLIDKNIAKKIVESLNLSENDTVIEIGPGRGVLTELIAGKAGNMIAVEIDSDLCRGLEEKFKMQDNLRIVCADFLKWELPEGIAGAFKYIGNLPYCMSIPIIEKVLTSDTLDTAVFTVQKEVADRMASKPGIKSYGSLSLFVQFYARVEILKKISPTCFYPRPAVYSSVVRFTPHNERNKYSAQFIEKLFKIIRWSFNYRRKTVYNSLLLNEALSGRITKDALTGILNDCDISPNARAEEIGMDKYILLAGCIGCIPT